jgi:hypothetical protein
MMLRFSKRIRFVEADEVKDVVDVEKMPEKYGGRPGGCPPDASRDWIRRRLQSFPLPVASGSMPAVGGGGGGGGGGGDGGSE